MEYTGKERGLHFWSSKSLFFAKLTSYLLHQYVLCGRCFLSGRLYRSGLDSDANLSCCHSLLINSRAIFSSSSTLLLRSKIICKIIRRGFDNRYDSILVFLVSFLKNLYASSNVSSFRNCTVVTAFLFWIPYRKKNTHAVSRYSLQRVHRVL